MQSSRPGAPEKYPNESPPPFLSAFLHSPSLAPVGPAFRLPSAAYLFLSNLPSCTGLSSRSTPFVLPFPCPTQPLLFSFPFRVCCRPPLFSFFFCCFVQTSPGSPSTPSSALSSPLFLCRLLHRGQCLLPLVLNGRRERLPRRHGPQRIACMRPNDLEAVHVAGIHPAESESNVRTLDDEKKKEKKEKKGENTG